jgi:hypothetical protein
MGLAGFPERPVQDDDPLVCLCGVTLGTQVLAKPENKAQLTRVTAAHKGEHKRRLAHQAFHRGPADDCQDCPTHDETCRHA